jgi:hypothetical protein
MPAYYFGRAPNLADARSGSGVPLIVMLRHLKSVSNLQIGLPQHELTASPPHAYAASLLLVRYMHIYP